MYPRRRQVHLDNVGEPVAASDVSPTSGFRFVCYCTDCQVFARLLERPDVLDAAGGTDIFQMPAGHVKLTAGADALRCLRLSSERAALRITPRS